MSYKKIYLIISALVILPGLISLFLYRLNPGVDFTGGSNLELALETRTSANAEYYLNPIKAVIEANGLNLIGESFSGNNLTLRLPPIDNARKDKLVAAINQSVVPVSELQFETLGPTLGAELLFKTVAAVALAAFLIAVYVALQFKDWFFGLCATLATLHDSLVILGVFSLLGHFFKVEVDTLFVTAVLTVLSFSVHDTIVVYDRIREKMKTLNVRFSDLNSEELAKIIDSSTNETIVRSLNNSLTVIFMLTALFVLGGASLHWFALALLLGTISGTYSSPFVAGPLLIVLSDFYRRRKRANG
ncbi:MAG: protein translocase subunit SecF [Patescibacteria group bacterium]|nr:protein translocase subunit SecF [Patescibacteria group bacterium]